MKAIFRRTPDRQADDYTASHVGRGTDYDHNFDLLAVRALLTELESQAIAKLLENVSVDRVLDIACGTGRITSLLSDVFPGAQITGVDVSRSMLDVARTRVLSAEFTHCDIKDLHREVPDGSIDLVSAFRFFPNADQALRDEGFKAVARAVRPGGHLLLNNHRNFWSPSYVVRRTRGSAAPGALNRELLQPLRERGFHVVKSHSLGVLPHSDSHVYGFSDSIAERIESYNLNRLSRRHRLGTNTIWLLKRSG
ncbi:class I SAM-dependent DNA methyltransferase [Aeromicrobium sp. CF4.19]|uniref:class I SAM-dependent DNA methyltransferase n=1 Tax=Aeromicrobium sp. CF4.19 TaxID=3373082 RepID=UPI003EE739A8